MKTKLFSAILCMMVMAMVGCTDTTSTGDPEKVMDKKAYSKVLTTYDDIYEFHEGLCCVKKDNKLGFINKKGKEVIPCQFECRGWYDGVDDFSEGMARFMQVDADGNRLYGFINRKGEAAIPATYEMVWSFSNGLARFKKDSKYGFLDQSGNVAIEPVYEQAECFSEGLACVYVKSKSKYGYIDTKGEFAIPATYSDANPFAEGMAVVRKEDKRFVINQKEEVQFTLPKNHDFYGDHIFHDGLVLVEKEGKSWDDDRFGYMNAKGEVVIPFIYKEADEFEDGVAKVEIDDNEFYIDTKGNVVTLD